MILADEQRQQMLRKLAEETADMPNRVAWIGIPAALASLGLSAADAHRLRPEVWVVRATVRAQRTQMRPTRVQRVAKE